MKFLFILLLPLFFCTQTHAQKLPITTAKVESKIHIGPGTEDVVLDTFQGRERLLVSCNQRRKGLSTFGEIVAYYPAIGKLDTLELVGGPISPAFNPHGIDIVNGIDGKTWLFVVNHNYPAGKPKENSVIVYEVGEKQLRFKGQYTDALLTSINDVSGLPDGSFYVTIDSKHRKENFGWLMEKLFAMRTSTIVYCNKDQRWSTASKHKLAYANGIHADADRVLVAATQKGDLVLYKLDASTGKLTFQKDVVKIKGMDNISMVNDHELMVPSHPSSLKFLKHAKNASKPSPGIVDLVDIQKGTTTHIYANDGSQISANSVALYYKGKVYIGQVFENFLLIVSASIE